MAAPRRRLPALAGADPVLVTGGLTGACCGSSRRVVSRRGAGRIEAHQRLALSTTALRLPLTPWGSQAQHWIFGADRAPNGALRPAPDTTPRQTPVGRPWNPPAPEGAYRPAPTK